MATATEGRRGRRSGPSTTREDILRAARHQFAEAGYDQATVRGIARAAGVDPSLVIQQFGSKADLFETVVSEFAEIATERIASLPSMSGTLGERLARSYFSVWEEPDARSRVMAIFRSVGSSDIAVNTMVSTFVFRVWPLMRHELGRDDVDGAMAQIASVLIGTAMTRYILDLPFTPRTVDELVATMAPVIDGIVARWMVPGAAGSAEAMPT